ncbi:MMPL family transporter [Rosenbergiella collisarenosi]|uniref:MMPL family transporter n=1 Tax=Rosenbergiella collisarenosi TaxID=1544695 RepID=UPI001BD91A0E|nr:MMPL family transporter [Rosenbergiella collisarenosi]MBT0719692.1 MMPL family transporter [Rosenbergiella collisarenosi]
MSLTNPRYLGGYWLAICLLLLVALGKLLPESRLNNSVLSLLPVNISQHLPAEIYQAFTDRLDRQVVWMIAGEDTHHRPLANNWLVTLRQIPELASLQGPMTAAQQQQWGGFFVKYRNSNIDELTRQRLANGGERQVQWVLSQLYSTFSGVSGQELRHDPLMLIRGAQLNLAEAGSALTLSDGWLTARDAQGKRWYFLHGEIGGSQGGMAENHRLVEDINRITADFIKQNPSAKILTRGTLFYSDHASEQAKSDMQHLGTTTLVGLVLLILWIFRSLRPLFITVLSISIGALAGGVVVLTIWHEIHLMTVVMSMSIIGISADYSLYYLCERRVFGRESTPWQSLTKVGRTLLLAVTTTVIAYGIMLLAPFPGIQQMAAFSIAGLSASCLTVYCWHPWLSRGLPTHTLPFSTRFLQWITLWRHNRWVRYGIPTALTLFSAIGLTQLRVDDDISQLQTLPPSLVAQEKAMAAMTQQSSDQKWFVVYGATPEIMLNRLAALRPALRQAQHQRLLGQWRALPLNALAQQTKDQQLIKQAAPLIEQRLKAIGISDAQVDTSLLPLTPDEWLNSPVSEGWRLLWFQLKDGTTASLVPVSGVIDSQKMSAIAAQLPGIVWIDRKASFDDLFSHYRQLISGLIIVALIVIAISAMVRQGWKQGLTTLVPSILSLTCGLASLALRGEPITLFSILALNLVLGIGINYTLFFGNPRGTPVISLQAITLALVTTLLTLGMLLFSSTQAISSFGTVLCSGILVAWLLSPLAMPSRRKRKKS